MSGLGLSKRKKGLMVRVRHGCGMSTPTRSVQPSKACLFRHTSHRHPFCPSLSPRSYEETLSTLNYANRAKAIKNVVTRNEDSSEVLIRALRDEIEALRKALAAAQQGGGGSGGGGEGMSDAQRTAMEDMLANLERAKAQSWEERERLSAAWEAERQRNLANEARIASVMATLKEEHAGLIKRLRGLVKERERGERLYRKAKKRAKEL